MTLDTITSAFRAVEKLSGKPLTIRATLLPSTGLWEVRAAYYNSGAAVNTPTFRSLDLEDALLLLLEHVSVLFQVSKPALSAKQPLTKDAQS